MDTMVFDRGHSTYLVNAAHVLKRDDEEQTQEIASKLSDRAWSIATSNPMVKWIGGDFVEGDNPNSNTQFWTAGDLELAEYTITDAPLNMIHRYLEPVGFFRSTQIVKFEDDDADDTEDRGSMKIAALSGMWTHLFPMESDIVDAANDAGLLFYSMECRGTHLTCGTDEAKGLVGCGETFEYMAFDTHCEHLQERSSVRHIVSPTFRGGALIVPPVRPGWKNASAGVVSEAVMQEAASYAEKHEAAYISAREAGADISATEWEMVMAQLLAVAGED